MASNKYQHICFIAGTLGQGGAERQLLYLIEELIADGSKVSVVALTSGEFYENKLKELGAIVYNVKNKNKVKRFLEIAFTIKNKIKPTYIFSMHFYTNLYALFTNLVTAVNYNGSLRNNLINEIKSNGFLGLVSYFLPVRIIANSINASHLSRNKRDFILTDFLPNKINLNKFKYYQRTIPRNNIKILNVGRLEKQKNQQQAVWLISELIKNNINASLTIVGDGSLLGDLKKEVRNCKLEDKVVFAGKVENVEEYYKNHDLLVLTSLYEGTPNVVLEANASGLPVISSISAGDARYLLPKEYLYDGTNLNFYEVVTNFLSSKENVSYKFSNNFSKSILKLI
jgi:glycosyltransferase involved in cell wall biosynthesis